MSIKNWLRIFKSQKQSKSAFSNADLSLVADAFYHGKYRECIQLCKAFDSQENHPAIWDIRRFNGLSHFRLKRFGSAQTIFKQIAAYSNNTDDWFNLMNTSVRNGDIETGEWAYDQFNHPESVKGDNPMLSYPNVTYQLMIALQDQKHYQKALEKLIVIKRYITQVKAHHSEYLAAHRIPFVFQTLVSAKETLVNVYTPEQIERFLDDFALHLDPSGRESVEEFRATLR